MPDMNSGGDRAAMEKTAELHFRSFTVEDAIAVSRIIHRCLKEVNSKDYPAKNIALMLPVFEPTRLMERYAGSSPIVACQGQRIAAIGAFAPPHEIRSFFVDPDIHRSGVGTALLAYLESFARAKGIHELTLHASITAERFYERQGYVAYGRDEHPVGGQRIQMRKDV